MIPLWWITYNMNKLTHLTYLVMYLVTIRKKKAQFWRILLAYILCSQIAPWCPIFEINGREASLWCQKWWITWNMSKLTHITYLIKYLVTIIKKNSNLLIFACPVYAPKLHPDASTFEINGHEASVWYQYDVLRIM